MARASNTCRSDPRFVGDPIDVVSGANIDAPVDLAQRGPILFQWVRYYSSARAHVPCSLGWGHSHDFDRTLRRDLDGLCYEDPTGALTGFPDLALGESQIGGGMLLKRIHEQTYRVSVAGQPDQEFFFAAGAEMARLARLRQREHTIELRYASNGALSEIVDSRGRVIRVTNDSAGRLLQLSLIDTKIGVTGQALLTYEYDTIGNLIRATDLYKTTLTFAYDAGNRMTRRADRRGYSFHFEYDMEGRCIHSRGDDGLIEVFLDYQPDARTTFVRRGDGGKWIYFYDEDKTITQITDPYGNATKYVHDDQGRIAEEIDPLDNVTTLHYNGLGVHDYRIDPNGHLLPTLDADPNPPDPLAYDLPDTPFEWEFGHIAPSESIKPVNAEDSVLTQFPAAVFNTFLGKTVTYDPASQERERRESSATESMATDDFDRPVEYTGPSHTERWKYDPNGNLIEHQDRDGAVSRNVYASWNALKQAIDPLGHAVLFDHTVQGLVAKITDPGGTIIEYDYDLKEKLVEVRWHGRVRERYRRDRAGNVIEKRDLNGRSLVRWEIGPGNLDAVRILGRGETHVFAHDESGRVTQAETPAGTIELSYDEAGRVLSDLRDGKGVAHEFFLGQLVCTTFLENFRVTYQIKDDGDLIVIDPLGGEHRIERSRNGLIAKHLANGDRELCQFDRQGRCLRKAIVRSTSGATPWMRSHAYSTAGDLVAISDTVRGQTRYSYDAAHRLTEEVLPDGTPRRFAYDAAGNLHAQPGLSNVIMDKGNRLREANGERFTYNERDHLSQRTGPRGTTRYEYNELDMLVRCDVNGLDWTASYDGYCRRVTKTWQGRTTTYYWDDFRLAAEVRHDGAVRIYVYVDEIALAPFLFVEYDNLEAKPEAGQRFYIFTNQVGVPIRVEDADGQPCWTARIDPYGRAEVSKNSTLEMPLRFPGHYCDAETGLHYNRFRYFSPELGRYLQPDPAGQLGSINLYAYPVDPLTRVDLDGLNKKGNPPKGAPKAAGAAAGAASCPIAAAAATPPGVAPTAFPSSTSLEGKTRKEVKQAMKKEGFKGPFPSNDGRGKLWMRDNGNGTTSVVRVDPGQNHPGKADRVPHAHKEVVKNEQLTQNGKNYEGKPTRYNDKGEQTTHDDYEGAHIPMTSRSNREGGRD